MLKKLLKKQQGFTLIEVVLVLALAALIIVIVLLALSGAQKARRDTQRKDSAGQILAAVESCASNNNGAYANCSTVANIMGATKYYDPAGKAPGGTAYTAATGIPTTAAGNTGGTVWIALGTCPGVAGGQVAVYMQQETGGQAYCVTNN